VETHRSFAATVSVVCPFLRQTNPIVNNFLRILSSCRPATSIRYFASAIRVRFAETHVFEARRALPVDPVWQRHHGAPTIARAHPQSKMLSAFPHFPNYTHSSTACPVKHRVPICRLGSPPWRGLRGRRRGVPPVCFRSRSPDYGVGASQETHARLRLRRGQSSSAPSRKTN
jgi:hypothetical protein